VTAELRAGHDAILVGGATVIADDPALTVRGDGGTLAEHQPLRAVLLGSEGIPSDARVLTDGAAPTVLLGDGETSGSPEIGSVPYSRDDGIEAALLALGNHGVNRLLVEPGPRLFSALVEAGLVDRLVVVTAGGLAGDRGPSMFEGPAEELDDPARALVQTFRPVDSGVREDVIVSIWAPLGGAFTHAVS
jgi:riboflavin biosynthesis pyrimidine reductase